MIGGCGGADRAAFGWRDPGALWKVVGRRLL